jgi:hypothetical protein
MIATKPKYLDPQGNLFKVFNVGNFYSNNEVVVVSQLMEYSNLYSKNIFYFMNSFINGLQFEVSINNISKEVFNLVAYLPNIIFELSNISYDEVNNSTNITGGTWFESTSVSMNLNVGDKLNTNSILSQNIITDSIKVNELNTRNLKIINRVFNEIIGFLYINSISLPLQKSNLLSNFNISPITSIYFSLKEGYRLDCVDINSVILFSYSNISNDYIYYQQIVYNINMIKVNLYDSRNILI